MNTLLHDEILTQTEGYETSDRYHAIPTLDVMSQFEKFGFEATNVQRANIRKLEKNNKQKHLVRMANEMDLFGGAIRPEIIIQNSYDTTSSLTIRIGMFRFACANGLIVGTNLMPTFKIRHSNSNWIEEINTFIDTYQDKYKAQKEWVDNLQSTTLTLDHAYHMAEQAIDIRHENIGIKNTVIDPLELLIARRKEDRGMDAWSIYNRTQEALINGYYTKVVSDGRMQKGKVITSTDEIIRVNCDLSDLFGDIHV